MRNSLKVVQDEISKIAAQKETHALRTMESKPFNDMEITTHPNSDHIEVISVDIVNVDDNDDSFASADGFVPEIPEPQQNLNYSAQTNQLIQLML